MPVRPESDPDPPGWVTRLQKTLARADLRLPRFPRIRARVRAKTSPLLPPQRRPRFYLPTTSHLSCPSSIRTPPHHRLLPTPTSSPPASPPRARSPSSLHSSRGMGAAGQLRRRTRARTPPSRPGSAGDDDVSCEACGSGHAAAELMLCDGCDRGFHIFCLRPILPRVPAGDWFCPSCRSPAAAASPVAKKPKREYLFLCELPVVFLCELPAVPI